MSEIKLSYLQDIKIWIYHNKKILEYKISKMICQNSMDIHFIITPINKSEDNLSIFLSIDKKGKITLFSPYNRVFATKHECIRETKSQILTSIKLTKRLLKNPIGEDVSYLEKNLKELQEMLSNLEKQSR